MIEDMSLRKLAPKTQDAYIRAVKKLGDYLGHSPHMTTRKDLRKFQIFLVNKWNWHNLKEDIELTSHHIYSSFLRSYIKTYYLLGTIPYL